MKTLFQTSLMFGRANARTILALGLIALMAVAILGSTMAVTAQGSRWVHNVTGGGKDSYPGFEGDPNFEISFNARVDEDGYTDGKVEWYALDGSLISSGDVTCLEVRDNRAYISYNVVTGDGGGYGTPGHSVLLGFEDNGEGVNEPADRQSYIYYALSSNYPCVPFADYVEATDGFPVEWVEGNVQVRSK